MWSAVVGHIVVDDGIGGHAAVLVNVKAAILRHGVSWSRRRPGARIGTWAWVASPSTIVITRGRTISRVAGRVLSVRRRSASTMGRRLRRTGLTHGPGIGRVGGSSTFRGLRARSFGAHAIWARGTMRPASWGTVRDAQGERRAGWRRLVTARWIYSFAKTHVVSRAPHGVGVYRYRRPRHRTILQTALSGFLGRVVC